MGDVKLFRLLPQSVVELKSSSMAVEKSLQHLIESNLESFLGIRMLASEYATGKNHGGRIDTLGIDENGSPVIVEYKRALNENVINQGLFYLDWLMDHRAEFKLLVMEIINRDAAESIDWGSPRLLCIASDFTKYDEHATKQISRSIELIRYRRFGEEFLLLELANGLVSDSVSTNQNKFKNENEGGQHTSKSSNKSVIDRLAAAPQDVQDRFEMLKAFLVALGDDVQVKAAKDYFAFRRMKNFACVEVYPQHRRITMFLKVDPESILLEPGFTRDVRKIGHFGTGDLEVLIHSDIDLERSKDLIVRSYQVS